MSLNDIREKLLAVLDELGIIIDNTLEEFDLQEYITDSITFITFIVNIEKQLGVEIPDDMLLITKMHSFVAYCEAMLNVVNSTYDNTESSNN